MKQVTRFCAIVILALVSFGFVSVIDGKWKGNLQGGPEGNMELIFNFKVAADILTGTVISPMGEVSINNGKVNGDEFSFDVDAGGTIINHQCKVLGDSILMKVTGMQEDRVMVIKREVTKE